MSPDPLKELDVGLQALLAVYFGRVHLAIVDDFGGFYLGRSIFDLAERPVLGNHTPYRGGHFFTLFGAKNRLLKPKNESAFRNPFQL
jgi:hypothetical protein